MERTRHGVAPNVSDIGVGFGGDCSEQNDMAVLDYNLDVGAAAPEVAAQITLQRRPGARPDIHVEGAERQYFDIVDDRLHTLEIFHNVVGSIAVGSSDR